MRFSFWLCVAALACALTSPASPQQAVDRVALVIGNSNYPDASTPLTSTSRDVRTVAAELRRLGFGVDLKENVTRQEMQAAIDAFMGKIGSGTAALFYFSGYGIQVARSCSEKPRARVAGTGVVLSAWPFSACLKLATCPGLEPA